MRSLFHFSWAHRAASRASKASARGLFNQIRKRRSIRDVWGRSGGIARSRVAPIVDNSGTDRVRAGAEVRCAHLPSTLAFELTTMFCQFEPFECLHNSRKDCGQLRPCGPATTFSLDFAITRKLMRPASRATGKRSSVTGRQRREASRSPDRAVSRTRRNARRRRRGTRERKSCPR